MPKRVTLYSGPATDGRLSFFPSEGTSEVVFMLADGYEIGEGFTGVAMIVGPPGTLGMSIDEALNSGVLTPVFDKVLARTEQ
jgi:hypothetical protein